MRGRPDYTGFRSSISRPSGRRVEGVGKNAWCAGCRRTAADDSRGNLAFATAAGLVDHHLLIERGAERLRDAALDLAAALHRIDPGAIEEREDSMVKDVEEANQREVTSVARAIARIVGQVDGQRPIGAEQPEEVNRKTWRLARRTARKIARVEGANSSDGSWPSRIGSSDERAARPRRALRG